VRDSVFAKAPCDVAKSLILPQGLLDPDFGAALNRDECREQVCGELHLPIDAFIVLGCGTLDLRKGIDHFAAIARETIASNSHPRQFHFVWVGDGPRWMHSPHHYVELDIGRTQAKGQIHFIGERIHVDPYFVAADAFLLSSRVDPFPCVVHEAMAVGLPVVAFDQSGGAVEALRGGAGIVIPYGDYRRASQAIQELAERPELVRKIRQLAQRRVHEDYRFVDYAEKVLDLIEESLASRLQRRSPSVTVPLRKAA
jgi:glycosyltransferase involved in cell wall biosynthesis